MKTHLKSILLLGALGMASPASAVVIIADTFTGGGNGGFITGRTPETSLPGGNWEKATDQAAIRPTTSIGFGNPLPGSFGSSQAASAVSIASAGTYVKPTTFTISADISTNSHTGLVAAFRGAGLGFFAAIGSGNQFSQNQFSGIVLANDGSLTVVNDPNALGFNAAGVSVSPSIAFAGGIFDTSAFHRLSYDVNTVTGSISNISFGGSTADYSAFSSATYFTDANTTYAGINSSSEGGSSIAAKLDNFSVTTVPEPTSTALVALGLGGLVLRRRRI